MHFYFEYALEMGHTAVIEDDAIHGTSERCSSWSTRGCGDKLDWLPCAFDELSLNIWCMVWRATFSVGVDNARFNLAMGIFRTRAGVKS